jgi:hypothetical protein
MKNIWATPCRDLLCGARPCHWPAWLLPTTCRPLSEGVNVAERQAQEHLQPNGALLRYELLQHGPEHAIASPLGVDDIDLPGVADRTNGVRVAKAAVVVFQFAP